MNAWWRNNFLTCCFFVPDLKVMSVQHHDFRHSAIRLRNVFNIRVLCFLGAKHRTFLKRRFSSAPVCDYNKMNGIFLMVVCEWECILIDILCYVLAYTSSLNIPTFFWSVVFDVILYCNVDFEHVESVRRNFSSKI